MVHKAVTLTLSRVVIITVELTKVLLGSHSLRIPGEGHEQCSTLEGVLPNSVSVTSNCMS